MKNTSSGKDPWCKASGNLQAENIIISIRQAWNERSHWLSATGLELKAYLE